MRNYKNLGTMIRVRRLSGYGTGQVNNPASAMGATVPPLLGGSVAALTTVGIRHLMEPTTETQIAISRNAPWIGLGAGVLTALSFGWLVGQPAAISSGIAAGVVTLGLLLNEWATRQALNKNASGETLAAMDRYGLGPAAVANGNGAVATREGAGALARARRMGAGTRAIVPEYGGMRGLPQGTGAIVFEPSASRGYGMQGNYGDVVTLRGLRAISPSAFGTPGFST